MFSCRHVINCILMEKKDIKGKGYKRRAEKTGRKTSKNNALKNGLRPIPTEFCDLYLPHWHDLRPIPTAFFASCDLYLPFLRPIPTAFFASCDLYLLISLCITKEQVIKKGYIFQLRPIPTEFCDLYLPSFLPVATYTYHL